MASFGTAASSRPPIAAIKKSILNFIKGLVPYYMYDAIRMILSPCCIEIASANATCEPSGTYSITVTLNEPTNFTNGLAFILSGGTSSAIVDGQSNTFTFTGVTASPGSSHITFQVLMPLSYKSMSVSSIPSQGIPLIAYIFPRVPVVFPSCT